MVMEPFTLLYKKQELLAQISNLFFNGAHHWAKSGNTQHMRIINLQTLLN